MVPSPVVEEIRAKGADVVFLDLHDLAYVPLSDVTNQVVHGESGAGVVRVMVRGRFVVDQRRLTLIDEAKLAGMAEAAGPGRSTATARATGSTRRATKGGGPAARRRAP